MRQDTAPQLATRLRSYTIRWDTGPQAVYTCQQCQFLADWQHQQVNRTGTSAFPCFAGQLVVAKRQRGERRQRHNYTPGRENRGRGEAHTIMRMRAFSRKNGRLYIWPSTEGVLDLCNGAVSEKTPQIF